MPRYCPAEYVDSAMPRPASGRSFTIVLSLSVIICMNVSAANSTPQDSQIERRIDELIAQMTLAEKVGQMSQVNASHGYPPDYLGDALRAGRIGSILNNVDVDAVNELQRIAVEESRLGIPLLVGRDVIHGFKTVMPIPLGQAASWNPGLVEQGARVAAREAATAGINWTFAPMIDVSRDPRWGRIAESLGEDPLLASRLGAANRCRTERARALSGSVRVISQQLL